MNLQIIRGKLEKWDFQAHYTSGRDDYPLAYPSIYTDQTRLADHILYILKAEEFPNENCYFRCPSCV